MLTKNTIPSDVTSTLLSFKDIQKQEGVYATEGRIGRIVVLKYIDEVCVLYVGSDKVEPASPTAWIDNSFIKTSEKFSCFIG